MASESSCLSGFHSAAEGFEAPGIQIEVSCETNSTVNYETIVFPNAPIQK